MTNCKNNLINDPFFRQWEKQLKDVSYILDFLHTYPNILIQLKLEDFIESTDLINSQHDWIRMCARYEGLEKDFFQPFWVPILKLGLNYFIDLSDENYPIFKTSFLSFKPYAYHRMNLFDSINDLMLLMDAENQAEGIESDFKDKWLQFYCRRIYGVE
jgi:hypothetical protein